MRPGGEVIFVDTNERFSVMPSQKLQQEADARFGEETYYAKVDTTLPERAPRRWERKAESGILPRLPLLDCRQNIRHDFALGFHADQVNVKNGLRQEKHCHFGRHGRRITQ